MNGIQIAALIVYVLNVIFCLLVGKWSAAGAWGVAILYFALWVYAAKGKKNVKRSVPKASCVRCRIAEARKKLAPAKETPDITREPSYIAGGWMK